MPVTVEINGSAKIVFSTFVGEMNEQDLISVAERLASRADFDPTYSHLINFCDVTVANVSTLFLRTWAERQPLFDRNAKQVIVAPQVHLYGLARMIQILRDTRLPNIEVVRSLKEAQAILGLEAID